MCLHTVDFALKYDTKGKFYYGVGYKNLLPSIINGRDELVSTSVYYSKWRNACHNSQSLADSEKHGNASIMADDYSYYPAGFHVFLDQNHARRYDCGNVYKVMFRDVIAFGENEYYFPSCGPCVIAKKMKIIEKVI